MAATTPADLAQALKYGPKTQQAVRRSQYLSDALKQQIGTQNVTGGWGEVGARLLATAILSRANDKAQAATLDALKADQNDETDRLLGPLKGGLGYPATSGPIMPPQAPAEPLPVDPGMSAPSQGPTQPAAAPAPSLSDPAVRRLAQLAWHEARGEPAAGQQGVAAVALNRARESGKPLDEVVFAPHQFSGFTPERAASIPDEELAKVLPNIAPALAGQDPTGGADHFFNPTLANPSWGQGDGRMIGQHKFMSLGYGGQPAAQPQANVQMTAGPAPQASVNASPNMAQAQPQPFQVAAANLQPGMVPAQPSAPGSSPPAAGTPPAAPSAPQAPAAGGNPWPTWKPSQQQYDYVQSLLMDPRTHAQGVQEAMKMREKMTQPVEATVQMINNAPFYVAKDPTSGATVAAIPVPREAMTQIMSAQSAGLQGAPQGLNVQRDPLGNLKEAPGAPPEAYEVGPGGQLQYRQGGPADPARPQTPGAGYQYAQQPGQPGAPLRQQAIEGGPADPRSPNNLASGVLSFKKDLDPIVTNAMKVRQNYGAVTTGFRQQNGSGDIAMVNGLQRLIDEGVVKAEDVALQMKSNGLDGQLGGYAQFISSQGFLTPDVRNKIYKTAGDLYQNLDQTYRARVMSMQPAVDEIYGPGSFGKYVFPQAMVDQMGWGSSPAPGAGVPQGAPATAPQFKPGTADAALAEAMKRPALRSRLTPQQVQRARELGLM